MAQIAAYWDIFKNYRVIELKYTYERSESFYNYRQINSITVPVTGVNRYVFDIWVDDYYAWQGTFGFITD